MSCPVWIMKPQEKSSYQRIMAAIDFDINNDKADEPTFNRQILEFASTLALNLKADMVVMGTVGRGGIPGLIIGNTAEAILDQLQCSVLAMRPPGFKTPGR